MYIFSCETFISFLVSNWSTWHIKSIEVCEEPLVVGEEIFLSSKFNPCVGELSTKCCFVLKRTPSKSSHEIIFQIVTSLCLFTWTWRGQSTETIQSFACLEGNPLKTTFIDTFVSHINSSLTVISTGWNSWPQRAISLVFSRKVHWEIAQ